MCTASCCPLNASLLEDILSSSVARPSCGLSAPLHSAIHGKFCQPATLHCDGVSDLLCSRCLVLRFSLQTWPKIVTDLYGHQLDEQMTKFQNFLKENTGRACFLIVPVLEFFLSHGLFYDFW